MKSKHLLLMLLLALLAPWAANGQTLNEGFESTTFPPDDWTTIHVSGGSSWVRSTGTGASTSSAFAYRKDISGGYNDYLITPKLVPQTGDELSFYLASQYSSSYAGTTLTIEVSTTTPTVDAFTTVLATYNSGSSGNFGTTGSSNWVEKTVDVSAYIGQEIYIAFHATDPGYNADVRIDNVSGVSLYVPSCTKPSTLTATAPYGYDAAHCILLQWEDGSGSYNVQLKKASESEEQWQSIAGGFSDYALLFNTLDPATTYNARVQSVCGGDVSDWKTVTFTTGCDAITTFPWSETFESYASGNFSDPCWVNEHISGDGTQVFKISTSTMGGNSTHQLQLPDMNIGTLTKLVLPEMALNGNYQFVLDVYRSSSTYNASYPNEGIRVYASTDGQIEGATEITFIPRHYNVSSSLIPVETAEGWYTYELLIPITSGSCYIILQGESQYCTSTYMDNFIVRLAPTCLKPIELSADNITTSSADLSWTAQSGETTWNIYYKKTSEELWEEVQNVTANPYTLQGLDPASNYQFKVVAKCSATDLSEETQPVAFATECEAIAALGYTENFDSYTAGNNVLPTCWSYINTTTYTNYSYYPRIYSSNAHSASNSLYLYSSYSSWYDYDPQPQYAILPEMTGLAGMQVALYAKGYNTSSTFKIGTMSNPNDASTFTMIAEQTLTTSYPADAYEYIIPTTCTDNYLAIMIDAATSTRTTNGVYIDDIDIHEPPSCAKPTNVTATTPYGHGATINWNAGNDETAWQICVIDNNVESAPIDVTSKPHTLSGLDPETTYQVKVRANCGGSFSEWTNAISFTTTVACPAPTSLTGEANEFDATITWQGTASSWEVFYSDDNTVTPDDNIDGTATSTTYTKTGLPLGDHYFWVRAICGGEDGNSTWVGPASVHIGYCVPNPSTRDGKGITKVQFGMGSDVVNNVDETNGLPSVSPFYGDYSAMIGAVQAGVESTVSITYATGSSTVYSYGTIIWIDFNNDMEFSDDEIVYTGTSTQGSGGVPQVLDATITIPATQATGDYRMRIAGADSYFDSYIGGSTSANHSACFSSSYSVCHDYTLRVLEAPSCLTPTNVEVTYAGGTSATISWTSEATAWNMRVNGVDVNGVITNPYTLTGLELATTYSVEVQANCGSNGLSEWSTPASFTTDLCMPENMCEINYSFTDQYDDSWNSAYMNIVDALTGEVLYQLTMPSVVGPYEGSFNVCDGRDIQFVWVSGNYPNECGYVFSDINDEVILEKATGTTAPAAGVVITHTVDCTLPTCAKPTAFAATNPGPHSIDLSWTENGTATQWQICLNGDETQPVTANTNPFTLTGLDPETDYTVKVRAYCDDIDQSAWSNEESFTTDIACPVPTNLAVGTVESQSAELSWEGFASNYNVRYRTAENTQTFFFDDFESGLDQWTIIRNGGGTENTDWRQFDGNFTSNPIDAHSGTYMAMSRSWNNDAYNVDNWLITPQVTLNGTLRFWVRDDGQYHEHYDVYVSTTGNSVDDFTLLHAPGDASDTWTEITVDLSSYAGALGYIALRNTDEDKDYLMIDDFGIYGSTIIPAGEWVNATTNTNSIEVTGLNPATTYDWQVQADCGSTDGESEWSTIAQFTTQTFTMTKNIVANSWYALSSPVNTPNVTDVTNLTVDDYDFYRYNEVTSTWENYKAHSDFTTFENGRGYIYRNSTGNDLTFTGVPNTAANYPYILTTSGSGDLKGFNLLGNPFANPYIYSGNCYALTEKGTWMAKTNYTIPVCEAVLVKVSSEANYPYLSTKSAPKAVEALAFTVSGNGYEDVTYAMLEEGEGLNKVAHLTDEAPALSIPVDGSNYAIAYLGYEVESFPLTLNATAGEYTIALNNQISGLSYCHLLDKVTGKETDLLKGAYTFKANGNSDRFTVLLNASLENGEIAIWNGNSWIVNGEGTLQVFDVMGRRVYNQEVAGQSSLNTDELATGVYVIRLGEKSQKIVVK